MMRFEVIVTKYRNLRGEGIASKDEIKMILDIGYQYNFRIK